MSFGDFSAKKGGTTNQAPSYKDAVGQLSEALQTFQKTCITFKDAVARARRRPVGPNEKQELDIKMREIRSAEGRLKNQLDFQIQQLDKLPRAEAAPKRNQLSKLMKDFDRLKQTVTSISNEFSLIKVSDIKESEAFSRVGSHKAAVGGGGYALDGNMLPPPPEQKQMLKLQPLLKGVDIDEAIIEERDRDIKKMNDDLKMVNEIFKDMANLVDRQGAQIDKVYAATEESHEKAKAGLDQVKQAAAYQPVCLIS